MEAVKSGCIASSDESCCTGSGYLPRGGWLKSDEEWRCSYIAQKVIEIELLLLYICANSIRAYSLNEMLNANPVQGARELEHLDMQASPVVLKAFEFE